MPRTGKISQAFFREHIAPQLGAKRPETTLGPQHGVDFGVLDIGGQALAVATDPVSILPGLGFERAGRFAVRIVLADVAVSGLDPSHDRVYAPTRSQRRRLRYGLGGDPRRMCGPRCRHRHRPHRPVCRLFVPVGRCGNRAGRRRPRRARPPGWGSRRRRPPHHDGPRGRSRRAVCLAVPRRNRLRGRPSRPCCGDARRTRCRPRYPRYRRDRRCVGDARYHRRRAAWRVPRDGRRCRRSVPYRHRPGSDRRRRGSRLFDP